MNKFAILFILASFFGNAVAAQAESTEKTVEQVPAAADKLRASVPELKQAVLAATKYDAASLDLTATPVGVVVTLVNSKLASGPNAPREAEANKIAGVIADAISGKPEFAGVQAIHVDYITRDADGDHTRTIDKIDFRKDAKGQFQHHIS